MSREQQTKATFQIKLESSINQIESITKVISQPNSINKPNQTIRQMMQKHTKNAHQQTHPFQLQEEQLKKQLSTDHPSEQTQTQPSYVSFVTKLQMRQVSPYRDNYTKELLKQRSFPHHEHIKDNVNKSDLVYFSEFKTNNIFNIEKIRQTRNKKMMNFEVLFSRFVTIIKVLNLDAKDHLNPKLKNWINQGGYGVIYQAEMGGRKYAIKKLNIDPKEPAKSIHNAIKECSFMKLCGVLGVGPAYWPVFGFDIVTTESAIYFSCEMGLPIYEYVKTCIRNQQQLQRDFSVLEQSLILLHSLKLTHNDIKTSNIVYSESMRKLVLIDYGLSEVSELELGFMKMQHPKGSIDYCCEDMRRLFFDNFAQGMVDMFYNDAVALQKSKENMKSMLKTFGSSSDTISNNPLLPSQNQCQNLMSRSCNMYFGDEDYAEGQSEAEQYAGSEDVEQIVALKIVYLIYKKEVMQFQQFFHQSKLYLSVLNKHFKICSFAFFQAGRDTAMELIYRTARKLLQAHVQILPQTEDCINFQLEPYFNIALSGVFVSGTSCMGRSLDQKISRASIGQRYNEHFPQNHFERTSGDFTKGITTVSVRSLSDTSEVLAHLIQSLSRLGYSYVSQIIALQVARVISFYYWYQITEVQVGYLEDCLLKLGLKVRFEVVDEGKEEVYVGLNEKLIFYVGVFLEWYMRIIEEFEFCWIVCKMVQEDTPANVKIDEEVYRCFTELSKEPSKSKKRKLVYRKLSQGQLEQILRQYSEKEFVNLQYCLNIAQKFIKVLQPYYDYPRNLQMNMKFCGIMDQKVREMTYYYYEMYHLEHTKGYDRSMFLSAHFCLKVMLTKFRDHKRRVLSGLFAATSGTNDFVNSAKTYQMLFYEFECLKLHQIFTPQQISYLELPKLFQNSSSQINNINTWFLMQKNVFQAMILTSFVPYSEVDKLYLLQHYFGFLQKDTQQRLSKVSSYVIFFVISRAFDLAMEVDDYEALKRIFRIVEQSNGFIANINFSSMMFQCVRKRNNSRKIKHCEKNFKYFERLTPIVQANQCHQIYTQVEVRKGIFKNHVQNPNQLKQHYQPKQHSLRQHSLKQTNDRPQPLHIDEQQQLQKRTRRDWQHIALNKQKYVYLQSILSDLRYLLKKIYYSKDREQGCKKLVFMRYLEMYEKEVQGYERWIGERIGTVRGMQSISGKMCEFFGIKPEKEVYFWGRITAVHCLLVRYKLIQTLTQQFYFTFETKTEILQKQWELFQARYNQLHPRQQQMQHTANCYLHQRAIQLYSQASYRVKVSKLANTVFLARSSSNPTSDNSSLQRETHACIGAFIEYVQNQLAKIQRVERNTISTQMKQFMIRQELFMGVSSADTFMGEQSFLSFILLAEDGVVDKQIVAKTLQTNKKVKAFFKAKFEPQQLIKNSLQSIVNSNRVHKFFCLEDVYLRILYRLIQIGLTQLLSHRPPHTLDCHFLTYLFYHLFRFAQSEPCSSYSYLMLGLVNYFHKHLLHLLQKTYIQSHISTAQTHSHHFNQSQLPKTSSIQMHHSSPSLSKAFQLINSFENDLIRIFIDECKQSKIISTCILLLSCQKVKLQLLIQSLKTSSLNHTKIQNAQNQDIHLKPSFLLMEKIEYLICFKINQLQFLSKSYMRHYLFCYLVTLNLADKRFLLSSSPFAACLAFARPRSSDQEQFHENSSVEFHRYLRQVNQPQFLLRFPSNSQLSQKERYFEINHLRHTRKIIKRQKTNLKGPFNVFEVNQKFYYSIFEPIDQTSLSRIALKQLTGVKTIQNGNISNQTYSKVYNRHEEKVHKFIRISCMDAT